MRNRMTNKQRQALIRKIKELVNNNVIGTSTSYFMPGKVVKAIQGYRGTSGLPRVLSADTITYWYRKLLNEGELIIKKNAEGDAYLVTKEHRDISARINTNIKAEDIKETNNEEKNMNNDIEIIKTNDDDFRALNENKVQKSIRNTNTFLTVLNRATKGEFDETIATAKGQNFLKIIEKWSIHKLFSLEEGKDYYKLYKEVFYVENPKKHYFDTVKPTIYRRIRGQHEQGDIEWAKAVAKKMNITIIENE